MELARMDPVNAALRFVCELVALYGIGAGVRARSDSLVLALAAAVLAAAVWAVFRVPDDPGQPPVTVPGAVRLLIEALVLGGGVLGLWAAHGAPAAVGFGAVLVAHYATTPRRLRHVVSCHGWGRADRREPAG